jgi:hypothetical protein
VRVILMRCTCCTSSSRPGFAAGLVAICTANQQQSQLSKSMSRLPSESIHCTRKNKLSSTPPKTSSATRPRTLAAYFCPRVSHFARSRSLRDVQKMRRGLYLATPHHICATAAAAMGLLGFRSGFTLVLQCYQAIESGLTPATSPLCT